MVTRVLNLLPLALLALPLKAQVRVQVIAANESDPMALALREAVLSSRSFVVDRDTSHVRFWVQVIPGGGMRCGPHTIKAVTLIVTRVGPNYRSDGQTIFADAYEVGGEAEQARRMLAQIDQAAQTR